MCHRIIVILMILTIILSCCGLSLAEEETSNAVYRTKWLMDRLSILTDENMQAALLKLKDMSKHWSKNYVSKLTALEIISGYPDGTFRPEETLQVDEYIKLVVKALGYTPEPEGKYWAEAYIKIAKEENLIGDKEFTDYTRPITREEMAKITMLAAMKKEADPVHDNDELISANILDFNNISIRCRQYIITAYNLGLMGGMPDGTFKPGSSLTRGEASAVVARLIDVRERTPFKPENGFAIRLNNYAKERHIAGDIYYAGVEPNTFTVCKPNNREEIRVAYAAKDAMGKSKGYSYISYNEREYLIYNEYLQSKQKFIENKYSNDMSFTAFLNTKNSNDIQYEFVLRSPTNYKILHRDSIVQVLKSIFGNDADKAIARFDKYADMVLNGSERYDERFTLDSRKIWVSLDCTGFSFRIYPKSN